MIALCSGLKMKASKNLTEEKIAQSNDLKTKLPNENLQKEKKLLKKAL